MSLPVINVVRILKHTVTNIVFIVVITVISSIVLVVLRMNSEELAYYISCQTFQRMQVQGILTEKDVEQIVTKLKQKYHAPISQFILDKA